MTVLHISWGGPTRYMSIGSRTWRFEDHPHFGPSVLDRYGEPSDKQPDEDSPFWRGYECWRAQGKKVNTIGDRTWCVFETELMRKRRAKRQGTESFSETNPRG